VPDASGARCAVRERASDAATPAMPASTRRRRLPPKATKRVGQYSAVPRPAVLTLLAVQGAALVLLTHRFVELRGTDTDLFPRWYALRGLFEGRDPYGAAVTAEIVTQTSLAGAPDAVRAAYGFVYPLPLAPRAV
jgi:hypothetical protein